MMKQKNIVVTNTFINLYVKDQALSDLNFLMEEKQILSCEEFL